jgi:predicted RNA-binding protein YlqC (UPF0109 family)
MQNDQAFLDYIIKALVDSPNDVEIIRTVDEMGVLLTLSVNPTDMGKVIGRQGNTAKAIRTLLRVIGMKSNSRVNLKINEPAGSEHVHKDRAEHSTADHTPTPMHTSVSADPSNAMDEALADLKGM